MSRLARVAAALVAIEAALYTAILPLLPGLTVDLDLSKTDAGVLIAAYPAGLIAGVVAAWWLSARIGVRNATVAGTIVLGVAAAGFGVAVRTVALLARVTLSVNTVDTLPLKLADPP